MPRPPAKKDWATRAELKRAVRAECARQFLKTHGVEWNPAWGGALAADYRFELELDRRALPLLAKLRAALSRAGTFLETSGVGTKDFYVAGFEEPPDDVPRHVGRVAAELRNWYSRFLNGEVQLPDVQEATSLSFRRYVAERWWMAEQGIGEWGPEGLDVVAQKTPLRRRHDLAVITILAGCFPSSRPTKAGGVTIGQVIDRESKAIKGPLTYDVGRRSLAIKVSEFGLIEDGPELVSPWRAPDHRKRKK